MPLMQAPSVVVNEVHVHRLAFVESKYQPPIRGDTQTPVAGPVSLKLDQCTHVPLRQ